MATIKISQLPAITGANTASTDVLAIVDTSLNATNKITRAEFFKNIQTDVEVEGLIFGNAVTQSSNDNTTGRLLKVGSFGLGVTATATSNLTTITVPGLYRFVASTTIGAPEAISFEHLCLVELGSVGFTFKTMRWTNTFGTMKTWIGVRALASGSTIIWTELYTKSNLLGTVSQASGVPTGSVFERGSNANGEYVRFADGAQICTFKLTASTSAGVTWTFPAVFSSAPVVQGNAVATVLAAVCIDSTPSATAAVLSVRDKVDARRNDVMHLVATGRWF